MTRHRLLLLALGALLALVWLIAFRNTPGFAAEHASIHPAATTCAGMCRADPLPLATGWAVHDGVAMGGMVLRGASRWRT